MACRLGRVSDPGEIQKRRPQRKCRCVHDADQMIRHVRQSRIPGIEGIHRAGEMAFCALGLPHKFDPTVLRRIFLTMSSVPSVKPSLTITHFTGRTVCATIAWMIRSIFAASLRAGVINTWRREKAGIVDCWMGGCSFTFEPPRCRILASARTPEASRPA